MKPPLAFILSWELFIVLLALTWVRFVNSRHVQFVDSLSSSCGRLRSGRVIGGDEVGQGEFPWIASIQSVGGNHFCAGFLISKRFVISASHCFVQRYNELVAFKEDGTLNVDSIKVAVNRVKLSDKSKVIGVKRLIMHPEFEELGLNNDIAILELEQEIDWDEDMHPICLPKGQNVDEYTENASSTAVVAGWGYRHCGSFEHSKELHKIEVPIWNADDCKQTYKDADYDFARKDYVCAGSDGKDITKGDSGGPLMHFNKENRWTAIGIVSSGRFMCSDRVPGVYTKISSYLQWIKSQAQL